MKENVKRNIFIIFVITIIIITIVSIVFIVNRNKTRGEQSIPQDSSNTNTVSEGEEIVETLTDTTAKQANGTIVNTSEKLKENKEIKGFKIVNISFKESGGQSELIADVMNETGSDQPGFLVDVVLYDKSGNEVGRIPASIISTKAGETIRLQAGITEHYVEAYDFKLEEK